MPVSIEKLLKLKLIKPESFSTGKPFETIRAYFCLRNSCRSGWSYPAQPTAENTLLDPNWQKSMFRGDWSGYAQDAGFVDDGEPLPKVDLYD